jgi:hypothetical protein
MAYIFDCHAATLPELDALLPNDDARMELAEADKTLAKPSLSLAEADKTSTKPSLSLAEADKTFAEASLNLAEADKSSTKPSLGLAEADKAFAKPSLGLAEADKAFAEASLGLAEADKAFAKPLPTDIAGTFDACDRFAPDLYPDRQRPFSINLSTINICINLSLIKIINRNGKFDS